MNTDTLFCRRAIEIGLRIFRREKMEWEVLDRNTLENIIISISSGRLDRSRVLSWRAVAAGECIHLRL